MPRRSNGPKNLWTIPELALTLYLRSRRVRDKDMTIVLNERYAPIVRRSGAIRNKMNKLRRAVIASGQIDLKYDRYFSAPMNVDRWIRDQVDNPDELSRLLTFTEHELEIMNTNLTLLNSMRGGSLVVAGPSLVPRNRRMPRPDNIQPSIGPNHMPAGQEPRRREFYGPGAGPSQVLDPRARQVMGGQGQMSGAGWPVWDATLESLFPNMGPPLFHGGFPVGVQQAADRGAAQDPYQESRDFEQWHSQEREEEGEDEDDEDDEDGDEEDGDDQVEDSEDDDGLNEYRPQRDENDNCWYDEDQEELDG